MAIDPSQAVDIAKRRFGNPGRARALFAKGTWASGTFTAAPEAPGLSRAAHLQGDSVPVLMRFSNASGDPAAPDYEPDIRGLAVRFRLPDGGETDLLAQSVPRFLSPTPDGYLEYLRANSGRTASLKIPAFLARHPRVVSALASNASSLEPVSSYVNCRYYTHHAFCWQNEDGATHHVRCDWRPEAGEIRIGEKEARTRGRDYLSQELVKRLDTWPARMILDAQIADPADPVDDPSTPWPASRRRVDIGRLEVHRVLEDPEAGGEVIVFDPTRLTRGIALTADPVLSFRTPAYKESAARRRR